MNLTVWISNKYFLINYAKYSTSNWVYVIITLISSPSSSITIEIKISYYKAY